MILSLPWLLCFGVWLLNGQNNVMAAAPNPQDLVEPYVVDLNLEPEHRWTRLVQEKKLAIEGLLGILKPIFTIFAPKVTTELIEAVSQGTSEEYVREMRGISDALIAVGANISYEDVAMANLFYEITGVGDTPLSAVSSRSCTSIVAQRDNGTVYLARNQDYPPPFTLVMVHAIFKRDGEILYEGTTYAGTIGLSTAMTRRGSYDKRWAVSINARSNPLKGKAEGLRQAVESAKNGGAIYPLFTRMGCDAVVEGYSAAKKFFSTRPLIMPGYMILGGANPGEGSILTRNASIETGPGASDDFSLFSQSPPSKDNAGGVWFVVQTNTDHWEKAPLYPGYNISRREQAVKGLDACGTDRVDLQALWKVLDTTPTYNPTTIHTDLVAPVWGEYRTYKRNGPLHALH